MATKKSKAGREIVRLNSDKSSHFRTKIVNKKNMAPGTKFTMNAYDPVACEHAKYEEAKKSGF